METGFETAVKQRGPAHGSETSLLLVCVCHGGARLGRPPSRELNCYYLYSEYGGRREKRNHTGTTVSTESWCLLRAAPVTRSSPSGVTNSESWEPHTNMKVCASCISSRNCTPGDRPEPWPAGITKPLGARLPVPICVMAVHCPPGTLICGMRASRFSHRRDAQPTIQLAVR